MKRTAIYAITALMGMAVCAPLAANADECRRDHEARPFQKDVRIEYRREDNDHGFRDNHGFRDHEDRDGAERVRVGNDRHERR